MRRLLLLTTLLAAATACGGDDDDATSGDTRTVEGAYGPIDIPVEPARIVGDLMTVDYLRALGFDTERIVGVFDAGFFPADHYLADVVGRGGMIDPGFQFEPNLELVAAAEPDLIVAPFDQIDGAPALDELREIAPVLVVPTSETRDASVRYGGTASFQDWRTTLRTYGALMGLDDEAEAYITETEERIADLRAEHGDLIDSITATEVKSTPDSLAINALDTARESGVLGTILMSELGFVAPPQQQAMAPDEYGLVELSPENVALVDGDLVFLEVRESSTRHEDNPLWPTLQVVQADAVFPVGNHWEYGGAVAARRVLEDIDAALDTLVSRR